MAGLRVEHVVVEVVEPATGGRCAVWRVQVVGPACLVCGRVIPSDVPVPADGERACTGCGVVR